MRVISITHSTDADGMISQALVLRRFKDGEVELFRAEYTDYLHVLESARRSAEERKADLVVITDISVNEKIENEIIGAIRRIAELGCKVVYLDHHPSWSKNAERRIGEICEVVLDRSETRSCAQIVAERFLPGDKEAEALAFRAYTSDYRQRSKPDGKTIEIEKAVARTVACDPGAWNEAVRLASSGDLENPFWRRNHFMRLKEESEERPKLLARLEEESVCGRQFYFGWSDVFYVKQACMEMEALLKNEGKPPGLIVMFDPVMKQATAMRGEGDDFINLKEVCTRLGGGGHPDRAGFYYEPDGIGVSQETKARFIEMAKERMTAKGAAKLR